MKRIGEMMLACVLFAGLVQVACGQVRLLEIDVFVSDPNDGFVGLLEVSTAGLPTNAIARVKGQLSPGDGEGAEYRWNGEAWVKVPGAAGEVTQAELAAALAAESGRAQAAEAALEAALAAVPREQPSVYDIELSRSLMSPGLVLGGGASALTKSYDVAGEFPTWGWWKVREGASNSGTVLNQASVNGQQILAFFDSSGNGRKISAATSTASFWVDTNTISTGEVSASFGGARPYEVSAGAVMTAAGATFWGVSDSDVADTGVEFRRLFVVRGGAGSLFSLGMKGATLKLIYEDAIGADVEVDLGFSPGVDTAFAWLLSFDRVAGVARLYVNNVLVGTASGMSYTASAGQQFLMGGDYDGSAASDGWDGQHAEMGVISGPLSELQAGTMMRYLQTVSGLDYSLSDAGLVVHEATLTEVTDGDATRGSYAATVDLPAGRVAVGIKTSTVGGTLTVSHGADGGSAVMTNASLSNLTGDNFESGVVFTATGGSSQLSLSLSSGEILGVIVRRADALSGIVEDQGTGMHCYPLAIEHTNGKTYRVHAELYSSRRFVSDGTGGSVEVFGALDYNERYHNGAALIEVDGGDVLVAAVRHGGPPIFCRVIEGGDLNNLSATRSFAGSAGLTYIHLAKRESTGAVYGLTRNSVSPTVAGLLVIDDPGDLASSTTSYEQIVTTDLRLYPRKLSVVESGATEYLACVWATRTGANWEGVAAVYQDLETGVWHNAAGLAAPSVTAPYFPATATNSTVVDDPDDPELVIFADDSGDQWYLLNDALLDFEDGELKLATTYATKPGDSVSYGESEVWQLTYSASRGVERRQIAGLAPTSYRADWQFLEIAQGVGIAVASVRGARASATDATGDAVQLYYDFYGEDFRFFSYLFDEGRLLLNEPRELPTANKNGLTHGWLSRIHNSSSYRLDVQPALNEMHFTHRQTERSELLFEQ